MIEVVIFDHNYKTYIEYRYALRIYEQWCIENFNRSEWKIKNINVFVFKNKSDAAMFKIRIEL